MLFARKIGPPIANVTGTTSSCSRSPAVVAGLPIVPHALMKDLPNVSLGLLRTCFKIEKTAREASPDAPLTACGRVGVRVFLNFKTRPVIPTGKKNSRCLNICC